MIEALRSIFLGLSVIICFVLFYMVGKTDVGLAVYFVSFLIILAWVIGVNWRNRKN